MDHLIPGQSAHNFAPAFMIMMGRLLPGGSRSSRRVDLSGSSSFMALFVAALRVHFAQKIDEKDSE